jgi:hypothetical protein
LQDIPELCKAEASALLVKVSSWGFMDAMGLYLKLILRIKDFQNFF